MICMYMLTVCGLVLLRCDMYVHVDCGLVLLRCDMYVHVDCLWPSVIEM